MVQNPYTEPKAVYKSQINGNKPNNIKEFHIKIIKLLAGGRCCFIKDELDELIKNMDNFNINTLSIQKGINRSYYCKVDDATVELYKGKE